jgi:rhodanese-related sulfurtransferase
MNLLSSLKSLLASAPRIDPATATERLRSGTAVLVDVREPAEWRGGVAQGAVLLPLSDLTGARKHWRDFLSACASRTVFVYCASGMRSHSAAAILRREGVDAANAGGLGDLAAAGWPIVRR